MSHDDEKEEDKPKCNAATINGKLSLILKFIGAFASLGVVLILGAYTYTWNEMKDEQEEKRQWRMEHQRVLDKKFDEVRKGQDRLEDVVNKNTNDTKDILVEILIEQKKVSNKIKIK